MTRQYLTSPALDALPDIRHGFFTRRGGVSTGLYTSLNLGFGSDDDPADVAENRDRVVTLLKATQLQTLYQVHGNDAVLVERPLKPGARPRADALVTTVPGLGLGILTADCVPVLLADAHAGVIGAAHAGWRGAKAGVIKRTVDVMTVAGARANRIHAAIGPAIGQASYEVGDEVRQHFLATAPSDESFFKPAGRHGHWLFALADLVAARLRAAGINQVERLPHDTYAQEDLFYSYRRATHRAEPDYGRQISAIVLGDDKSAGAG